LHTTLSGYHDRQNYPGIMIVNTNRKSRSYILFGYHDRRT